MKGQDKSPLGGERKKFDLQKFLASYGKTIVFVLLIAVTATLMANNPENALWIVPVGGVLVVENAVKFWALNSYGKKIVCYVLDTVCLLLLTYFSDGNLISTLYMIILSEFYLSQPKLGGAVAMFICETILFLVVLMVSSALKGARIDIVTTIVNAVNDLLLLTMHFFIFNFVLQIMHKNREIAAALNELNESNEKLRRANRELQEITALEERQRIAKDIHDTAGHSITTVIMQTEAAKLVLDRDPEEAKKRIAAANLQAKHALEELRESVHLLSGIDEHSTLRDDLLSILHDSTDGTGIVIRSDVDDVTLCDAKRRFLCNTLKEGISNGLRHGGATAFYFELKREGDVIRFLLSDNGRGMDLSALREGFGLKGMHRRAESLGGTVWFETEEGEGFEIHLTLPADKES